MTELDIIDPLDIIEDGIHEAQTDPRQLRELGDLLDFHAREVEAHILDTIVDEDDGDERERLRDYLQMFREQHLNAHRRLLLRLRTILLLR